MPRLPLVACALLASFTAFSDTGQPLTAIDGLSKMGISGTSGMLIKEKNCEATYKITEAGEIEITVKKISADGKERIASATMGPKVMVTTYSARAFMHDVAFEETIAANGLAPEIYYDSFGEEIGAVTIEGQDIFSDRNIQCAVKRNHDQPRAINVNLTSNGGSFDIDAEKKFYRYAGTKLSDQTLEQVKVDGYGDEGGKFYCLEVNQSFYGKKLEKTLGTLMEELRGSIVPKRGTTFSMNIKKDCSSN